MNSQADDPAVHRPRRKWIRRILLLVVLSVIGGTLSYGLWMKAYEYALGWSQDRCTFGPVSNERYLEWLAKAKEVPLKSNPPMNIRPFEQLSAGAKSLEERIAVVHAWMRANGFLLRGMSPDTENPYGEAETRVDFVYKRFYFPGIIGFCAFGCETIAVAHLFKTDLQDPKRTSSWMLRGRFSMGFSHPDLISGLRKSADHIKYPYNCPPMPPPQWLGD